MVASRKPRKAAGGRHRETLEEKFQRLLALPVDAPMPKLTKSEARYFLRGFGRAAIRRHPAATK